MRLLVASHDASRTGAPLLLLTVLRWIRRETDADIRLVLWRGGPLVPAFADVAELTVLHPEPGRRSMAETVELGLGELGLRGVARRLTARRVRRRLDLGEHDVLYLNGAGAALVLPHLGPIPPAVAHVHELARGLRFSLPEGPADPFLTSPVRIIAVAERVARELEAAWAVDPERIVVLPGCLPDRAPGGGGVPPPAGSSPLVGSVGAGSWRKGIDLFLDVAATVRAEAGDGVRFAWVGRLDDPAAVQAEVAARGLTSAMSLPGEVADPEPWYQAMSVFCSTAREDPFPLVALEAGAAGVPIVAFDSGGVAELLADGRGTLVGSEDVDAMAAAVLEQLADPTTAGAAAVDLRRHVRADHTIDRLGPALWAELVAAAR